MRPIDGTRFASSMMIVHADQRDVAAGTRARTDSAVLAIGCWSAACPISENLHILWEYETHGSIS
jgi:hypothetical protein